MDVTDIWQQQERKTSSHGSLREFGGCVEAKVMYTKWFQGRKAAGEKVFKLTVSRRYEEMASNFILGKKNSLWMWCHT